MARFFLLVRCLTLLVKNIFEFFIDGLECYCKGENHGRKSNGSDMVFEVMIDSESRDEKSAYLIGALLPKYLLVIDILTT